MRSARLVARATIWFGPIVAIATVVLIVLVAQGIVDVSTGGQLDDVGSWRWQPMRSA